MITAAPNPSRLPETGPAGQALDYLVFSENTCIGRVVADDEAVVWLPVAWGAHGDETGPVGSWRAALAWLKARHATAGGAVSPMEVFDHPYRQLHGHGAWLSGYDV